MNCSVVIPVYRSAAILPTLLERLAATLPQWCEDFEVILVNDGSPDDSWQVIEDLLPRYPFLVAVNLMRNYGQHNALLQGIRQAQYDTIVTMDDDMQHPPEEIGRLLSVLQEGYDVVYGLPREDRHSWWRRWTSRAAKAIMARTLGVPNVRHISAFRAFRTSLRRAFAGYESAFVSIDVLLTWGTTRFGHVYVRHNERQEGESNYNFRKLLRHTFNMVTGFSTLPLQMASALGFLLTLFGLSILVYVLGRYLLYGSPVPGFSFLSSIISIFSGAQLFVMGIFGEYMARMYFRTLGRPSSVVREVRKQDDV